MIKKYIKNGLAIFIFLVVGILGITNTDLSLRANTINSDVESFNLVSSESFEVVYDEENNEGFAILKFSSEKIFVEMGEEYLIMPTYINKQSFAIDGITWDLLPLLPEGLRINEYDNKDRVQEGKLLERKLYSNDIHVGYIYLVDFLKVSFQFDEIIMKSKITKEQFTEIYETDLKRIDMSLLIINVKDIEKLPGNTDFNYEEQKGGRSYDISDLYFGESLSIFANGHDGLAPVIESESYIYITNVNNPISIENMMVAVDLQAYDDLDGYITDRIEISSDGEYNEKVLNQNNIKQRILGDYPILFEVSDIAGNSATATVHIRVVDNEAPSILQDSILTYNIAYDDTPITDEIILNGIVAVDNHTENVNKNIIQNDYNGNETNIGSYLVKIELKDNSGNTSVFDVNVIVVDDVKPIFSGSSEFYKSYDVAKSINDIISFLDIKVIDEIDGDLTEQIEIIEDNYTGYSNKPGEYEVILQATDNNNNSATFSILITIGDDVLPFFLIDKNKVIIEQGINFQSNDLIKMLKDVGVIKPSSLSYTIINDTYSGNEEVIGLYNYDLKILYNDGLEDYVELEVEVIDPYVADGELRDNFFVKIWKWLKNALKTLWNWIKTAWNWVVDLFKKSDVEIAKVIRK